VTVAVSKPAPITAWGTPLLSARKQLDVLAETEAGLPSLLPSGLFGVRREVCKVDKLSCVRFGSARYSVPNRMLGTTVEVLAGADGVTILLPDCYPAPGRCWPNTR
jgi:hypothetical protein